MKNTLTITHDNNNKIEYQLINEGGDLPIAYHADTDKEVVEILEQCRKSKKRILIDLGDTKSGQSWKEKYDVTGYIGLSRGHSARFPILVYNRRSMGGGSLLDNCIIKIMEANGKKVLYQHPYFHVPAEGDIAPPEEM